MQIAPKSCSSRATLCVLFLLTLAFAVRMAIAKDGPAQLTSPASSATEAARAPAATAAKLSDSNAEPIKYIGPGSCAATSCHGSVKPVAGSRILQNEYSTWIIKDQHSHAYQALTGESG